jgi:hypothetical protein
MVVEEKQKKLNELFIFINTWIIKWLVFRNTLFQQLSDSTMIPGGSRFLQMN